MDPNEAQNEPHQQLSPSKQAHEPQSFQIQHFKSVSKNNFKSVSKNQVSLYHIQSQSLLALKNHQQKSW